MGQDVFISYKSEEFQEADWVRQLLPCGDAADIQRPQLGEACQVKALRLCLRQSAARQLRMACGISVA